MAYPKVFRYFELRQVIFQKFSQLTFVGIKTGPQLNRRPHTLP